MHKFAQAFVQNADGSWFCRAPAEFMTPDGKRMNVTPGATYRQGRLINGYDVARWLDDWTAHQSEPPGIRFL